MGTMEMLSEEMVEEIMSRLSPDSLIQFKLVCKSWYALIKSFIRNPQFVAKNLRNMASSSTSLAFIDDRSLCACEKPGLMKHIPHDFTLESPHSPSCPARKLPFLLTLFHEHGGGESFVYRWCNVRRVTEDLHLPRLVDDMNFCCTWHYHCDGLVCFFKNDRETKRNSYFLCNPTTKELKPLPKPILSGSLELKGAGLSYDCTSDDYKFVIIGCDPSYHPKAEMYSSSYDCWKEIRLDWRDLKFDFDVQDWFAMSGIFYRGVLYWILDYQTAGLSLISFDVADELFHRLPWPSDDLQAFDSDGDPNWIVLTVWNGSIALLHCCEDRNYATPIEIWVMDNCFSGGIEGSCSWTKQLKINPLVGIPFPVTFWKGDELLMSDDYRRLLSYNVRSQKLRILAHGIDPNAFQFLYVRSLVSVHRRKQKEKQTSGKLKENHLSANK